MNLNNHCKLGTLIPGDRPFVIAHRGAAGVAPENTIEAIEQAKATGVVQAVEIDVRLSQDKVLVLKHDRTVNRTTNGTGLVSSFTLAELKRLDAGYWFSADGGKTYPYRGQGIQIATLDEVLARFTDMVFLLELKDSSNEAIKVLSQTVARHNAYDRVIVVLIGAKHRTGVKLRKLDRKLKTSHTAREVSLFVALSRVRMTALFQTRGLSFEVPMRKYRFTLPTPAFIRQAQRKGISVFVWTINDVNAMRKCVALGVDGIITDNPVKLAEVIRGHER